MGKHFKWFYLCISISLCWVPVAHAQRQVIGWLEMVAVNNSRHPVEAKIDTGADNSSLNAVNQKIFERDDQPWVKFNLVTRSGKIIDFEKPIIKKTRIKMKDGKTQMRNVIEIDVCIGTVKKKIQVNLVDRSHFKYQMLIGRSFLINDFLVDSAETFTMKPACL